MIKVSVTGIDKLATNLNNIAVKLRTEMKAANKKVGEYLEEATRRTFDMSGPGWKKLKQYTIDRKGHSTIMIDYGGYRGGINHKVTGNYEGEVFPDGPDYPRIDKHSLALVHERGAVVENGFGRGIRIVIPPRPVFQKTARRERVRVAGFYLRALRRAIGISV